MDHDSFSLSFNAMYSTPPGTPVIIYNLSNFRILFRNVPETKIGQLDNMQLSNLHVLIRIILV